MSQRATSRARLWPVDALRGLALLNMLAYHAMYDWVYLFGHASAWYDIWSPGCHVWQQYICWSFLLLSGFSFSLSRRPLKNGMVVTGCALVLTLVTVVAMPEESIWFGVLHLLGCAMLLTCLLRPALEKIPPAAGLAGSTVLFLLTNQVPYGALGFETLRFAQLPASLYARNWFALGFPDLTVFFLFRLLSPHSLAVSLLDGVLFWPPVLAGAAPPRGHAAGGASPAVRCGPAYVIDLYAPSAGDLRCAVAGPPPGGGVGNQN